MAENGIIHHDDLPEDDGKRDFIFLAAGALGAIGAANVGWALVKQMDKAADTLALGSIDIDVGKVAEGQQLKVLWRGKPVFVRHRTAEEIAAAEDVDLADLPDPETDDQRLVAGPDGNLKPQYLVQVGVCTHFGCVPVGEQGDYDGWFCPCHGSHYDTSGRIRKGPAPRNMEVPPYEYLSDTVIKVG
jgi:ubiquinol-cytochrome c reductase iron-sulfur subunit